MKDKTPKLEYTCFICNKTIEKKGFDISAVVLITNWDDEKKQRSQQFFCHAFCLKEAAHDKLKSEFYILDDNFE